MLDFLPAALEQALSYCNLSHVYELRIRDGCPTYINDKGTYRKLFSHGTKGQELVMTREDVEYILNKVSDHSIYSVSEQIREGFITLSNGIRIGLAGKGIVERDETIMLDQISSMCIRFPHRIQGCSKFLQERCFHSGIESTLILSKPGMGKTTFLRDIAETTFSSYYNILIVDERGELSAGLKSNMSDIIRCMRKEKGIEYGIRVLRPDVIMTDEITTQDYLCIREAMEIGIKVICSAHGTKPIASMPNFERYVVIDEEIGKIKRIYDGEKHVIYETV